MALALRECPGDLCTGCAGFKHFSYSFGKSNIVGSKAASLKDGLQDESCLDRALACEVLLALLE